MSGLETAISQRKELAHRAADGIDVTLYWDGADAVTVIVVDSKRDEQLEIAVRPDQAMNAFHHPYVYCALDRMHTSAALERAAA
jgi:YD repeat-containing protein